MTIRENSYGVVKRLKFIRKEISNSLVDGSVTRVLDVGCGTGEMLTIPLALSFKETAEFLAFDTNDRSLSYLRDQCVRRNSRNVLATSNISEVRNWKYRIIIISEIIEHVSHPIEFLSEFAKLLDTKGKIILTVPNGYGYFELDSMMEGILVLLGIIPFLRKLKHAVVKSKPKLETRDTLATSPHINFFSYSQVKALFCKVGLKIDQYEGRSFVCGFFVDRFIERSRCLLKLNDFLGSKLPYSLVSDWMFVASPDDAISVEYNKESTIACSPNWYVKLKRFINMKRYGMGGLVVRRYSQ